MASITCTLTVLLICLRQHHIGKLQHHIGKLVHHIGKLQHHIGKSHGSNMELTSLM